MRRPSIATLSSYQRQELIKEIKEDESDFPHKPITIETLSFCDNLIEDLKTSKIKSLGELRKILEIESEKLKKSLQNN